MLVFIAILLSLAFVLFLILLLWPALQQLLPLFPPRPISHLPIRPNELGYTHVLFMITFLLIKPLLKLAGFVPPLRVAPNSAAGYQLPNLSVTMPFKPAAHDIQAYDDAVGRHETKSSYLESSPFFPLVATSTPLALLLLSRPACPILPLGSVNVRNRFEFTDPQKCEQAAQGKLHNLVAVATLQSKGRRVKHGVEIDIVVDVRERTLGEPAVRPIFRQTLTFLQFLKPAIGRDLVAAQAEGKTRDAPSAVDASQRSQILHVTSDAPRKWAAVCKDYNPIHVSNVLARLFGFRRKIAHGNLVVAMAASHHPSFDKPDLQQHWDPKTQPWWAEVNFRRPVFVPAELEMRFPEDTAHDLSRRFDLVRDSKVLIEGSFGKL